MNFRKISVVTGTSAAETVKAQTTNFPDVIVHILPISVAAFVNPKLLLNNREQFIESDLIIVPGMAYGDFSTISKTLNIEIVKGPRYAFDLSKVLIQLLNGNLNLSPRISADLLMEDHKRIF